MILYPLSKLCPMPSTWFKCSHVLEWTCQPLVGPSILGTCWGQTKVTMFIMMRPGQVPQLTWGSGNLTKWVQTLNPGARPRWQCYNVYHDGENLAYHICQAVLFANLTNRALLPLPCNSSVPPNKGHMLCPADTTRWFSRGTKCSRWVSWVQGGQNCSFWCRPQTLPGIRWPCLQRWRCPAGRWLAMIMTHPHSGWLILLIVCLFNVIVFTRAALASDEGKMIFESNTDGHSVEVTGRHCTVWLWWWY